MRDAYGSEHLDDPEWSDVASDADHRLLAHHELSCHPLSPETAAETARRSSVSIAALRRLWRSTFAPVRGLCARYGVLGFTSYVVPDAPGVEITDDSGYEVGGY